MLCAENDHETSVLLFIISLLFLSLFHVGVSQNEVYL